MEWLRRRESGAKAHALCASVASRAMAMAATGDQTRGRTGPGGGKETPSPRGSLTTSALGAIHVSIHAFGTCHIAYTSDSGHSTGGGTIPWSMLLNGIPFHFISLLLAGQPLQMPSALLLTTIYYTTLHLGVALRRHMKTPGCLERGN